MSLLEFVCKAASEPDAELLTLLEFLVKRVRLRDFLGRIRSDREALGEIARRSYRHSNGFDKFTLAQASPSAAALRMHVWWGSDSGSSPNAHNHPWDYASYVAKGAYEMALYEMAESKGGTVYLHASYPSAIAQRHETRSVNTVRLRVVHAKLLEVGSLYCLRRTSIHQIIPVPGVTTVTWVLQGPHLLDASDVCALSARDLRAPYDVRRFSTEDVIAKFDALMGELNVEDGRLGDDRVIGITC